MIGFIRPSRCFPVPLPVFPSPIGGKGKNGKERVLNFPVLGCFGKKRETVPPMVANVLTVFLRSDDYGNA